MLEPRERQFLCVRPAARRLRCFADQPAQPGVGQGDRRGQPFSPAPITIASNSAMWLRYPGPARSFGNPPGSGRLRGIRYCAARYLWKNINANHHMIGVKIALCITVAVSC